MLGIGLWFGFGSAGGAARIISISRAAIVPFFEPPAPDLDSRPSGPNGTRAHPGRRRK